MSVAKDRQDTYAYFSKRDLNAHAKHLIENCEKYRIHKINDLHIFEWSEFFEVINAKSLAIKCFDTEDEAMNHCLDFYESTKSVDQQSLNL